jgi:hypothetical protein
MKIQLTLAFVGILSFSCGNEKSETTKTVSKPINKTEDSIKLAERKQDELIKAQREEILNSKKTDSSSVVGTWVEQFELAKKDVKTIDKDKGDESYQEIITQTYKNGISYKETIHYGDEYSTHELFLPSVSIKDAKNTVLRMCLNERGCYELEEKDVKFKVVPNGILVNWRIGC